MILFIIACIGFLSASWYCVSFLDDLDREVTRKDKIASVAWMLVYLVSIAIISEKLMEWF
jgi:hypothetical protein